MADASTAASTAGTSGLNQAALTALLNQLGLGAFATTTNPDGTTTAPPANGIQPFPDHEIQNISELTTDSKNPGGFTTAMFNGTQLPTGARYATAVDGNGPNGNSDPTGSTGQMYFQSSDDANAFYNAKAQWQQQQANAISNLAGGATAAAPPNLATQLNSSAPTPVGSVVNGPGTGYTSPSAAIAPGWGASAAGTGGTVGSAALPPRFLSQTAAENAVYGNNSAGAAASGGLPSASATAPPTSSFSPSSVGSMPIAPPVQATGTPTPPPTAANNLAANGANAASQSAPVVPDIASRLQAGTLSQNDIINQGAAPLTASAGSGVAPGGLPAPPPVAQPIYATPMTTSTDSGGTAQSPANQSFVGPSLPSRRSYVMQADPDPDPTDASTAPAAAASATPGGDGINPGPSAGADGSILNTAADPDPDPGTTFDAGAGGGGMSGAQAGSAAGGVVNAIGGAIQKSMAFIPYNGPSSSVAADWPKAVNFMAPTMSPRGLPSMAEQA